VEQIEEIAQGRVWLGNDALGIKLVDAIGSLDDAVKKAAELAKLKEYHTTGYPEPVDWWESLLEQGNKGSYLDSELRQALGEYYEPLRLVKTMNRQSAIQARLPYYLNIN
jgi:protease-4